MIPGGIEPPWLWLIGGVILLIAEIVAPGFFLVWIGVAAIVTGLFALLLGIGPAGQFALFALYAAIAVLVARRWYVGRPVASDDPLLNDRSGRLIGRIVIVVEAIDGENGRVRVGDGEWSARGDPAAPGERVRVTAVDGNRLTVERAAPTLAADATRNPQ